MLTKNDVERIEEALCPADCSECGWGVPGPHDKSCSVPALIERVKRLVRPRVLVREWWDMVDVATGEVVESGIPKSILARRRNAILADRLADKLRFRLVHVTRWRKEKQ